MSSAAGNVGNYTRPHSRRILRLHARRDLYLRPDARRDLYLRRHARRSPGPLRRAL